MSNPLYSMMQNQSNFLHKLQQFQRMIKGDPREQVQQLLNSGRVSQSQYNQAVQMANQLQRMISGK